MARPRHTRLSGLRAKRLRSELTVSEARVWKVIKGQALGARFRRQVPIGHYIVDFACLSLKVVIEVDDESHFWRDETMRTEYLESLGFTVLRFTNKEVALDIDAVAGTIEISIRILRGEEPEWLEG